MTMRDLKPSQVTRLQKECMKQLDDWMQSPFVKERTIHEAWKQAFALGLKAGLNISVKQLKK